MPKAPSDESVAIAALFHDLCKVNLYKTEKRNQKINGESLNSVSQSIHCALQASICL